MVVQRSHRVMLSAHLSGEMQLLVGPWLGVGTAWVFFA